MADDVLNQARTPADEFVQVIAGEIQRQLGSTYVEAWRIARDLSRAVLLIEAPRILALAYREAARTVIEEQQAASHYGELFTAHKAAQRLLALATALEEGTPA